MGTRAAQTRWGTGTRTETKRLETEAEMPSGSANFAAKNAAKRRTMLGNVRYFRRELRRHAGRHLSRFCTFHARIFREVEANFLGTAYYFLVLLYSCGCPISFIMSKCLSLSLFFWLIVFFTSMSFHEKFLVRILQLFITI